MNHLQGHKEGPGGQCRNHPGKERGFCQKRLSASVSVAPMRAPKNVDMDFECSVNVSSLSASSPTSLILIPVHIQEEDSLSTPFSTNLQVFIDSGAMGNFIHP